VSLKVMSAYCGGHERVVDAKMMTLRLLETFRALTSYRVDDNIVIDVCHRHIAKPIVAWSCGVLAS
jgi:hypothetical protein